MTSKGLPVTPDWVVRRFAPRVVIDVAPDAFTFSRDDAHRSLATYLYVRQRDGSENIIEPAFVDSDVLDFPAVSAGQRYQFGQEFSPRS